MLHYLALFRTMQCTKHILGSKHICSGLNKTYWAHAQQEAENTVKDDDVPPAPTAPLHKGLLICTTSCRRYEDGGQDGF